MYAPFISQCHSSLSDSIIVKLPKLQIELRALPNLMVSHKILQMFLHSTTRADRMIVCNGTRFKFAIDEAAALVLCVVQALDKINLTHPLIIFWDAALCSLIVKILNFCPCLKYLVRFIQVLVEREMTIIMHIRIQA